MNLLFARTDELLNQNTFSYVMTPIYFQVLFKYLLQGSMPFL